MNRSKALSKRNSNFSIGDPSIASQKCGASKLQSNDILIAYLILEWGIIVDDE
ncbi:MAG TPA: hypothetical protein VLE89_03910 [Chlamydiales bacterium]|nr:hypothetical protein [Chlamydiales bacterium]